MKGTLSLFGRGLLVLALSGFAVACGDDDGGDRPRDAGEDSGAGSGGSGGSGGAGSGGGGAGTDGGGLTPAQCEEMAFQEVGAECLACTCEEDPEATADCSEDCWGLVACVVERCGGEGSNIPCITSMCSEFIGAASEAMAITPAVTECADVCAAPAGDAGTEDAGN